MSENKGKKVSKKRRIKGVLEIRAWLDFAPKWTKSLKMRKTFRLS
jgi:hypothetical protein